MEFNKRVHESDEHGDPVRKEDGSPRLKTNWQKLAVDHMGRSFNEKLHGNTPELDDKGNLKMRRREAGRKPMTATNRTEAFVSRHRQPGYAYRVIADDPGRVDQFTKHDWEPVMGEEGRAEMNLGRGREGPTKGILVRKPQEWFDEDQKEKDRILNADLAAKTKPKTDEGQYGEGLQQARPSPLR